LISPALQSAGNISAAESIRRFPSHRKRNKRFEQKFHKENPPATVHNYVGIYRLTDVEYSAISGVGDWHKLHRTAKIE
jgi:hypothetical protein